MAKDTVQKGSFFDIVFTLKNTAIGFALTVVLLFLLSIPATFAYLPEAVIEFIVAAITYLSVGFCGFRAARHLGRGGLVSGALSGLIYVALLTLIGIFVFGATGFSISSLLTIIFCIVSGAIGGIIGINVRIKRRR